MPIDGRSIGMRIDIGCPVPVVDERDCDQYWPKLAAPAAVCVDIVSSLDQGLCHGLCVKHGSEILMLPLFVGTGRQELAGPSVVPTFGHSS